MEREYTHIVHGFEPVFDENCTMLILGSLPSVMSRKNNFYYGHPANRFWRVLAEVFGCPLPQSIEQKKALLLENHIAVWDVIKECDIIGSADSTIKNAVPTELSVITEKSGIKRVYANGSAAAKIFYKYQYNKINMDIITLPSTSPANAAWSFERLVQAWSVLKDTGSK